MNNKNFDIIITSYNRKKYCFSLVNQILPLIDLTTTIWIINSSDYRYDLESPSNVIEIKSSHKNQPYQRWLGANLSQADWVVFFDDDISIIDQSIFFKLTSFFSKEKCVGVSSTIQFEKADRKGESLKLPKALLKLSGEHFPKQGKIGLFGESNNPISEKSYSTEVFSGALMAYPREKVIKVFNETFLSLFERKLGTGEDKFISHSMSRFGNLYIIGQPLISHPAIPSTYSTDSQKKQTRVLLTRYWLAKSIGHAKGFSQTTIILQFIYYTFFRLIFSFINGIKGMNFQRHRGNMEAISLILKKQIRPEKLTPAIDWKNSLVLDCEMASDFITNGRI